MKAISPDTEFKVVIDLMRIVRVLAYSETGTCCVAGTGVQHWRVAFWNGTAVFGGDCRFTMQSLRETRIWWRCAQSMQRVLWRGVLLQKMPKDRMENGSFHTLRKEGVLAELEENEEIGCEEFVALGMMLRACLETQSMYSHHQIGLFAPNQSGSPLYYAAYVGISCFSPSSSLAVIASLDSVEFLVVLHYTQNHLASSINIFSLQNALKRESNNKIEGHLLRLKRLNKVKVTKKGVSDSSLPFL